MRLIHLSDTHIFGDGTLHNDVVDTEAALARVLKRAGTISGIDAVVVSGDLTDDGTPAAYQRLQNMVEPWARRLRVPTVYVMGNHDQRAGFEQILGTRVGSDVIAGFRIIRLDSSVPSSGYGAIDGEQIAWLQRELKAASDGGQDCIVVLHHPPIPATTPLLAALELQNPNELLEVCAAGSVRAILAGHYHLSTVTTAMGIPIIVAPAVANTIDVGASPGHERAIVGSGFVIVDIDADHDVRATPVSVPSPEDGVEIFDLGPEQVADIASRAGASEG